MGTTGRVNVGLRTAGGLAVWGQQYVLMLA